MKKGFTGKTTSDGRALVRFQGRVFAVPASRVGIVPKNISQNVKWTAQRRSNINSRLNLIGSNSRIASTTNVKKSSGGKTPCTGLSCQFKVASNNKASPLRTKGIFASALPLKNLRVIKATNSDKANLLSADRVTASKGAKGAFQIATYNGRSGVGYRPPYEAGTIAYQIRASLPAGKFVRVFSKGTDGEQNKKGSWFVERQSIQGLTPEQIKDKLALPEVPSNFSEVTGEDVFMQVGVAGKNEYGSGGLVQYESLSGSNELKFGQIFDIKEL
jgi:hypothetical protein